MSRFLSNIFRVLNANFPALQLVRPCNFDIVSSWAHNDDGSPINVKLDISRKTLEITYKNATDFFSDEPVDLCDQIAGFLHRQRKEEPDKRIKRVLASPMDILGTIDHENREARITMEFRNGYEAGAWLNRLSCDKEVPQMTLQPVAI